MEKYKLFAKDMHTVFIYFIYFTYFLPTSFLQSLTEEDDHIMTFKYPFLSYRNNTEKDVHLQLNSLPPPVHFCAHCCYSLPPLRWGHPLWMPPRGKANFHY